MTESDQKVTNSMLITDQLQRSINLEIPLQSIVSVVPSITELLCDLGLENKTVGRTKFCIHPAEIMPQIPKIGGTKQLKIDQIRVLQPDLIIANKEENDREQVEILAKEFPVWISDVPNFPAALEMILKIGGLVGRRTEAQQIVQHQQQIMADLLPQHSLRAAYLIWRKPYMTIGKDTYIHDMLRRVGFENVFGEQTRYPQFTLTELKERNPEVILLSSEPFPFKEKHIAELRTEFPNIPIELVDGEAFSWYGTRLLKTKNTLQSYQTLQGV